MGQRGELGKGRKEAKTSIVVTAAKNRPRTQSEQQAVFPGPWACWDLLEIRARWQKEVGSEFKRGPVLQERETGRQMEDSGHPRY